MTTLQQRYQEEHPWGEDDLARAANEHDDTHGGIIAEASLETRSDTAIEDMMRTADSGSHAGHQMADFEDAIAEEDEDLLAESQPKGASPSLAEGASSLLSRLGGRARGKPGDRDGDGVPDEADTDDDDDGTPDVYDPDWQPETNKESTQDEVPDGTQYEQAQLRMEDLRSTLSDAPTVGSGVDGLEDLRRYEGTSLDPQKRNRGSRAVDEIDPRYRGGGQEAAPQTRGGRGFGQFRLGR